MTQQDSILITQINPESIAMELGVESGDFLVKINGIVPKDYIDYLYLTSGEELEIQIRKANGEEWILDVEREYGEDLGIHFDGIIYDGLKECENHCMFCFVHQMPEGMRRTLSLKDDDYRFSFLQGSFITLTNLTDKELERIKAWRLSPLYVSVHTTNPQLRQRMMGNKAAGRILDIMQDLTLAGIEFHAQIVLCPEVNDGDELKRSIEDLALLGPNLLSLAIVPVGLTKYRQGLYPLRTFTTREAQDVFEMVAEYQQKFSKNGENFLYLSDEFYLLAQKEFPPASAYHGFPQLENGVGLSRIFLDQWSKTMTKLPKAILKETRLLFVTGILAAQVLKEPVASLAQIQGLDAQILAVKNEFFGENVTVAGLLTGQDLLSAILERGGADFDQIILPGVVLNEDQLFLDGMSCQQFLAKVPNGVFLDNPEMLIDLFEELNLVEVYK